MTPSRLTTVSTTLSGAGHGLLAWLGLSLFMAHARADLMPALQPLYLWGLAAGLALSAAGLAAVDWRALGQWRGSWSARGDVLALLVPLPALVLPGLLLGVAPGPGRAIALGACGLLLAVLALTAVACTAMGYASQPAVPAWRHRLVVPVFLLFALLTGLALLFWLMAAVLPFASAESGTLLTLAALGALLVACKAAYWHRIDRQAVSATHRHARTLRMAAAALLAGVPLLAWAAAAMGWLAPGSLLAAACLALFAGAFAERWLFFVQARPVETFEAAAQNPG